MLRKLMVLGGMLTMLLAAAAPALAQPGTVDPSEYWHSGTGVLGEAYTVGQDPTLHYALTDESFGTVYKLMSGFVELGDLVGMRIYFEGQQVQGLEPGPNDPIPVNVTYAESETGYDPAPLAAITGEIQPAENEEDLMAGVTHTVTEHGTGDVYILWSDTVDLTQYEGTSVTVYGAFQTQGAPLSNFEDPTEVLIAVTSVESLEPAPVEPEEEMEVLPDTGGVSWAMLGLIGLLIITGSGLLLIGLRQMR